MTFDKQFQITENIIDETQLNKYCEWVWYNVMTENATFRAFEVVFPHDSSDNDNPEYHLMYHNRKYNQMCLMKFNELILPKCTVEQANDLEKTMFPYFILIFTLGLLGNCLSTCMFFGTKLRYSSPSVYLGALAISDNCYLITIMLAKRYFDYLRKLSFFLLFSFSCLSAWLVIVFTVERFIAIKWPLRRKSLCTVARARIMIVILMILTFLVNFPEFLFVYKQSDAATYRICQNVIIIIIPVILITMFNILILYNIYKSYRNRRNLTANSIASENQNYENWMSQAKIFLVSFAFMFFNMPAFVVRIYFYSSFVMDHRNDLNILRNINRNNVDNTSIIFTFAIMRYLQRETQCFFGAIITAHIYITNFCINFLLYCVSGQNFRKELVDMFKKSINQLQNFYVHIKNR